MKQKIWAQVLPAFPPPFVMLPNQRLTDTLQKLLIWCRNAGPLEVGKTLLPRAIDMPFRARLSLLATRSSPRSASFNQPVQPSAVLYDNEDPCESTQPLAEPRPSEGALTILANFKRFFSGDPRISTEPQIG